MPRLDKLLGKLVSHTHPADEIDGLAQFMQSAENTRSICVNFYDTLTEVTWHNVIGNIKIKSFRTSGNVSKVYLSDGISITKQDINTLLANGPFTIDKDRQLTFEIVKTTSAPAALTIAFE